MKKILVTGGAGYIGSHTVLELIEQGYEPIVIDDLSNSSIESLQRVTGLTGYTIPFTHADLRDEAALETLFATHDIDSVIHFAGLKSVGESTAKPIEYYDTNITSTLVLCKVMQRHDVKDLLFSSSATVYGTPSELPLKESSRVGDGITNPYGRTKYMIEQILSDLSKADPEWNIRILRYFNPVGAHKSGQIGEDPSGVPNNLLPYVARVATGTLDSVRVFGNDYDTVDGTGVRDYIHVVDLAKGHIAALDKLRNKTGLHTYNLGTGKGASVLEVIAAFSKACQKDVSYTIVERRPGDIASCYADCSKALEELDWKTMLTLQDACEDSWRWQSSNPNGFKK